MLRLWLIRHGQTEGNRHNRYIGKRTDEPLCPEGENALKVIRQEHPLCVQQIYVSPMLRAKQTAQLLFPGQEMHIVEELSECDFGEFENKNYLELSGNQKYQEWIDSNAALPFPGGESREAFRNRSLAGLEKVICHCMNNHVERAAVVLHGGNIMNLMESLCSEERSYYEWHVKNGSGYEVQWAGSLNLTEKGCLEYIRKWP